VPKQKSHSGAKKRFRVTGTGKISLITASRPPLTPHQPRAPPRRHAGKGLVAKGDVKLIRKLLPNL
jgi:large subunit ribosomal protein L35